MTFKCTSSICTTNKNNNNNQLEQCQISSDTEIALVRSYAAVSLVVRHRFHLYDIQNGKQTENILIRIRSSTKRMKKHQRVRKMRCVELLMRMHHLVAQLSYQRISDTYRNTCSSSSTPAHSHNGQKEHRRFFRRTM